MIRKRDKGGRMKLAFWICIAIAIFGGELTFKRKKRETEKKDDIEE